jgi:hypothetical protein
MFTGFVFYIPIERVERKKRKKVRKLKRFDKNKGEVVTVIFSSANKVSAPHLMTQPYRNKR